MKKEVHQGLKGTATTLRKIADLLESDMLVSKDLSTLTNGLEDARKSIEIYALIEDQK